jgi:uncharacterized protein YciI
MYYLLLYDVVEDYVARRAPYREEHLKLAHEVHERGELVMAGAFLDPTDGAALLFRAADAAVAARFAERDPYVRNGLVTRWKVRGWNVVVGG